MKSGDITKHIIATLVNFIRLLGGWENFSSTQFNLDTNILSLTNHKFRPEKLQKSEQESRRASEEWVPNKLR